MAFSRQTSRRQTRRSRQTSRQTRMLRALRIALVALPLGGAAAASEAVPGPPLEGDGFRAGAWCPAPASRSGGWNAAGFGAAVLAIGWVARRRDPQA